MAEAHDPWTLTARWVFPVAGPPLERGTITVQGDRIVAVEPHGIRTADHDLGNVAVLPGLVNAHTHLDLSGMRGLAPPTSDFTSWLRQVIAYRRGQSPQQALNDIEAGLQASTQSGTTLLGDIAGSRANVISFYPAPPRVVCFRELLGLTKERAEAAWESLAMERYCWGASPRPPLRLGISPHAPYSVHASFFGASVWQGVPVAIHLAETAAELELLSERRGPFVPFLQDLGVWHPEGLARSPEEVLQQTNGRNPVLYVHCNYLQPDAPIPPNGSIVYCPRTHAAFGHPPHPFREFLKRGVRVALGTDSLASNPDLDLLAEGRFLHSRYPDVPGATVLRMATLSGAEALGWADETGSLESGKSADLVVLPLPDEERADPHELFLQSTQPVQLVLWRGQWRDAAQPAS